MFLSFEFNQGVYRSGKGIFLDTLSSYDRR